MWFDALWDVTQLPSNALELGQIRETWHDGNETLIGPVSCTAIILNELYSFHSGYICLVVDGSKLKVRPQSFHNSASELFIMSTQATFAAAGLFPVFLIFRYLLNTWLIKTSHSHDNSE